MKPELILIFMIFLVFVTLEIVFTRFFSKKGQTRDDAIVEIASTLMLTLVTQPLVIICAMAIAGFVIPQAENSLANLPFWAMFALFLIFDDMAQYWWHRLSHTVHWMYKLHRPHHNAAYLSIRVVYRNNFFFYLLMPGLWFSGLLIYLGGGWVYAVFVGCHFRYG